MLPEPTFSFLGVDGGDSTAQHDLGPSSNRRLRTAAMPKYSWFFFFSDEKNAPPGPGRDGLAGVGVVVRTSPLGAVFRTDAGCFVVSQPAVKACVEGGEGVVGTSLRFDTRLFAAPGAGAGARSFDDEEVRGEELREDVRERALDEGVISPVAHRGFFAGRRPVLLDEPKAGMWVWVTGELGSARRTPRSLAT